MNALYSMEPLLGADLTAYVLKQFFQFEQMRVNDMYYEGKNIWYRDGDGFKQGTRRLYHDNGKVKLEEHYVDGKLEGNRSIYTETGLLWLQSGFSKNVFHGTSRSWEHGKLVSYSEYNHGDLLDHIEYVSNFLQRVLTENGWMERRCYLNGEVRAEFYLDDGGLKTGKYREYHLNGNKKAEIDYEAGKYHGDVKRWRSGGLLFSHKRFEHGVFVEQIVPTYKKPVLPQFIL